jgi:hypothetical protein
VVMPEVGLEVVAAFMQSSAQAATSMHTLQVAVVSPFVWSTFFMQGGDPGLFAEFALPVTHKAASSVVGSVTQEQKVVLRAYIETAIAETVGSEVAPDDMFMEMGIDSLEANDLTARLAKGIGMETLLPPSILFDYPTVTTLTGFLETLLVSDYMADDLRTVEEEEENIPTPMHAPRLPNRVFGKKGMLQNDVVDTVETVLSYENSTLEDLVQSLDDDKPFDEVTMLCTQLAQLDGMTTPMFPLTLPRDYPTVNALSDCLAQLATVTMDDVETITSWEDGIFKDRSGAPPIKAAKSESSLVAFTSWTRGFLHGLVYEAVKEVTGVTNIDPNEALRNTILKEEHATKLRFELARHVGVVMLPPVFTPEYPSINAVVDFLMLLGTMNPY